MGIIGFLLVASIMGFIAGKKGFNPLLWLLAAGIPGFLILLYMPSANAAGIDPSVSLARTRRGNHVGAWISGIAAVLVLAFVMWASAQ